PTGSSFSESRKVEASSPAESLSRTAVLTSARADHPFRSAAFCSPRLCRRYFALACFALPRRNGSSARPGLGHHHECVDDQFLRRFLCLLHLAALLLARADFAICLDWDGQR